MSNLCEIYTHRIKSTFVLCVFLFRSLLLSLLVEENIFRQYILIASILPMSRYFLTK